MTKKTPKSSRFRLAKLQLCPCTTLLCTFRHFRCLTTKWNVLRLRFKQDVSIRQQFSFSFSDLRYTSFEWASLELSKFKLGSEAEGNKTKEMNYLSLNLSATSSVLYFSASEKSVNFTSYSKLAYSTREKFANIWHIELGDGIRAMKFETARICLLSHPPPSWLLKLPIKLF